MAFMSRNVTHTVKAVFTKLGYLKQKSLLQAFVLIFVKNSLML